MSLNADWTEVRDDVKAAWQDESLPEAQRDVAWYEFQAVVLWTMACEIGKVTEDNYMEFYLRYKLLNVLNDEGTLTLESFHKAIGLRTNVTTKTKSQWMTGFKQYNYGILLGDVKRIAETAGF
jgi:hypothetical protein